MVEPSLPLQLSFPRALRRQIAPLRECLRRDVVWCCFTPGGAYDSVWDSVRYLPRQLQLFPVQVEGQVSQ